ncbi:MAG: ATP-binding cassette domain-containing protein [Alphaproteobacteria bacterium]
MAPPLLTCREINLTFGGKPLLAGAELMVEPGARLCLVGRNGSGKSTLLKIAAGMVEPDNGDIFLQSGTTIRYLAQEPDLTGYDTVRDFVQAGLGPTDDPYRADYLLGSLDVNPEADPANLSGGEIRRAALAQVLAPEPDILMLDEPTNHLDLPIIEWLESELKQFRGALILISHDRRFLENLTRSTVWLDRGRTRTLQQGFAKFEGWRDEVLAQEQEAAHKLSRKIEREEDWVRYGVTARRKRNVRRMAGLDNLREQKRELTAHNRQAQEKVSFSVNEGQKSGKAVIEAEHVGHSWPGKLIAQDFSIRIMRGDRIGLVGPNGSGKTTMLNILTGALAPDMGKVTLGHNLQMLTIDQKRESLDPDTSLRDVLTGGGTDLVQIAGGDGEAADSRRHVVSYMKDFLFAPEQAGTPVRELSGGERGRLILARALCKPSNLLVLDEPTNDLDMETLDLLQELIADYPGTVLLVSHDRDFLDRTVGAVITTEGEGDWTAYAGGYSDMLRQRGEKIRAQNAEKKKAAEAKTTSDKNSPGKSSSKRKLSYKEQYALDNLPDEIATLEDKIQSLKGELADPNLFSKKPERFNQAVAELETAEIDLAAKEEEWLRLEMLKEELGL